jgi:hypothetical protein
MGEADRVAHPPNGPVTRSRTAGLFAPEISGDFGWWVPFEEVIEVGWA